MTQSAEAAETTYENTIIDATFVRRDPNGFVFEFGDELPAIVELDELKEDPAEGSTHKILVERALGDGWNASLKKAASLELWDHYRQLAKEGAIVEGTVLGYNRGGLSVDVGIRGFVPMSQVDRYRVDDVTPLVGCKMPFKVIEFDEKDGNLVLSRRAILEASLVGEKQKLLDELGVGQQFDGVVHTVTKYGAFVEIGAGVQGLLHRDNMSWGRVGRPSDFLNEGDRVRVVVLDIDPERGRIGLGHKQLQDDPWQTSLEGFNEGDILEGEVTSLVDFGAFVAVGDGVEGLVHVTEISWERIQDPREALNVGDSVRVQIIGIDGNQRRLSLSVRRLLPNPWETFAAAHPVGSKITGKVTNFTDFGAFVEVAPGVDGLIHLSDFSWTQKVAKADEFLTVDQEIEAVVLELDIEQGRLGLGLKQLGDDPWAKAEAIAKPGEKIEVEITRLVDFGAFAQIIEGIEGLIHISELREDRVERVSEVVKPGQTVTALVTSFDRGSQRIGLSLKRDFLGEEGDAREYKEESAMALGELLRDRLGQTEPEND